MRYLTIINILYINLKIYCLKLINSKNIRPYKILINLTDLCNSKCKFCDIWKIKPENEIQLSDIKNTLSSYKNDLYWLSFSGGEVTLIKYFHEMIDYFKSEYKNLKIIAFTTNALIPNRVIKFAKYIKDSGFDPLITISLDGDEKIHDEVRGVKGNYNKCIYTYEKLKEIGIKCHFGITVSESNNNFIKNNQTQFKEKIKAVTFVHSEGIYNKKNDYDKDLQILDSLKIIYKNFRINKIYEIIEKIHIKISIIFLEKKRNSNIIPCDVLNSSVHIMPNGDVKPCMFMNKVGNIKEDKLGDILLSEKSINAKNEIKNNNCPKCWMNCYSPHSIMQHPFKSITKLLN